MIYRGMCANDERQEKVDVLTPAILRIDFGPWSINPAIVYAKAKSILNITPKTATHDDGTETFTTKSNVEAVKVHGSYSGQWHIGNEPDLEKITPQVYVNWARDIMNVILSGDANAKFWVSGGTQYRPPWLNQWTSKVWSKFTDQEKLRIIGLQTHYYVDNPLDVSLNGYLKKYDRWRKANVPGREILLSECGVAKVDYVDPEMANYPLKVHDYCTRHHIYGYCWYSQSKTDGYMPLQDINGETPPGETFKGIGTDYL